MSERMTEYSVAISRDGEESHFVYKAGDPIEWHRGSTPLDKVLASCERLLRKEWGEGVRVRMTRFEGCTDPECSLTPCPDADHVEYQFYVLTP